MSDTYKRPLGFRHTYQANHSCAYVTTFTVSSLLSEFNINSIIPAPVPINNILNKTNISKQVVMLAITKWEILLDLVIGILYDLTKLLFCYVLDTAYIWHNSSGENFCIYKLIPPFTGKFSCLALPCKEKRGLCVCILKNFHGWLQMEEPWKFPPQISGCTRVLQYTKLY